MGQTAVVIKDQPQLSPTPGTDSVYLIALRESGSNAWYISQLLRHEFEVRLRHVKTEKECRGREVVFIAMQGAPTTAAMTPPLNTVNAEWDQTEREGSFCRAVARWRLGDIPGEQELRVKLRRALTDRVPVAIARADTARFIASAHPLPALIAGFSYAVGENPIPANDEVAASLARRGQPFFGIEFAPLFFEPSASTAKIVEHLRLMFGTSYRSPGYDFYAGLNPLVLIDGLRGSALPVQTSVGRRWSARGNDTYFVAATVSAGALLSNIVGNFGK
jgi:hypothetical protein